jgi:hypothetical protein
MSMPDRKRPAGAKKAPTESRRSRTPCLGRCQIMPVNHRCSAPLLSEG